MRYPVPHVMNGHETDYERASALRRPVREGKSHSHDVWAGVGCETSVVGPLVQDIVIQLTL